MIEWQWTSFENLSTGDLYALLAARQEVFILEQQCLYADLDFLDQHAHHLLGWRQDKGMRSLVAYLRGVAPGVKFEEASLGRVLSVPSARGGGIGKALVTEGLRRMALEYPGHRLRISAQLYLERFYAEFGFQVTSAPYSEDGIPHVEMLR